MSSSNQGGSTTEKPPRRQDMRAWDLALRRDWRRWARVVAAVAQGRRSSHGLDDQSYHDLHAGLLACCRLLREGDEARRDYYGCLECLLRPWLTLQTLEHADPEILLALFTQSQEFDRQLNGTLRNVLVRAALVVLLLAALAGGAVVLVLKADAVWPSVVVWLGEVWASVKFAYRHLSETQRLLILGGLLMLGAMVVTWRTAKT